MAVQKFVTLTRVSTKKQGRSGLGLEAQENYINAYLENLHGEYEVIGQFTDIESGKNSNRTGLNEAIELAKDTGAILLVAKLDRLSRSVKFIAELLEDRVSSFGLHQCPMLMNSNYISTLHWLNKNASLYRKE